MLIEPQNKALYPLLHHYIGSQVKSIVPNNGSILFFTLMGQKGELHETNNGDMEILIENEIVYTVEKKVFEALITPSEKINLPDYLDLLRNISGDKVVTYRSRILVNQIIKVLESYVLSSDFLPEKNLEVRPFVIFNYKGNKLINCLN
jgi:hypothetical protein